MRSGIVLCKTVKAIGTVSVQGEESLLVSCREESAIDCVWRDTGAVAGVVGIRGVINAPRDRDVELSEDVPLCLGGVVGGHAAIDPYGLGGLEQEGAGKFTWRVDLGKTGVA